MSISHQDTEAQTPEPQVGETWRIHHQRKGPIKRAKILSFSHDRTWVDLEVLGPVRCMSEANRAEQACIGRNEAQQITARVSFITWQERLDA